MTCCIKCGLPHQEEEGVWPRVCVDRMVAEHPSPFEDRYRPVKGCGYTMFNNPIPVITLLQPVYRNGDVGLAVAQRADNQGWALFAGHVDPGETLEEAATRELREETGLHREIGAVSYHTSQHTPIQVLVCFSLPPISFEEWQTMKLCPENIDFGIMWAKDTYPLIFPLHQELVDDWFDDLT